MKVKIEISLLLPQWEIYVVDDTRVLFETKNVHEFSIPTKKNRTHNYICFLLYSDSVYFGSCTLFSDSSSKQLRFERIDYNTNEASFFGKIISIEEVPDFVFTTPVVNYTFNAKKQSVATANEFLTHVRLPNSYVHPIGNLKLPPSAFFYIDKSFYLTQLNWSRLYENFMFPKKAPPTTIEEVCDFISLYMHTQFFYRSDQSGESFDNAFLVGGADCEDLSRAFMLIFLSLRSSFARELLKDVECYTALCSAQNSTLAHMFPVLKHKNRMIPVECTRLVLFENQQRPTFDLKKIKNFTLAYTFDADQFSYFYNYIVLLIDSEMNVYSLLKNEETKKTYGVEWKAFLKSDFRMEKQQQCYENSFFSYKKQLKRFPLITKKKQKTKKISKQLKNVEFQKTNANQKPFHIVYKGKNYDYELLSLVKTYVLNDYNVLSLSIVAENTILLRVCSK